MRLPPNLTSAAIILAAALFVWLQAFPEPPHLHEPPPKPRPQLTVPTAAHSYSAAPPCPISAPPLLWVANRSSFAFGRGGPPDPCDQDKGIFWFRPRALLPPNESAIYLYFGKRGGFTELMLFIQRLNQEGDEATRIVAEFDGSAVTLLHPTCMFADVVRGSGRTPAGASWEEVTFGLVAPEDVAAVRDLANASRVVLGFVGKLATQEWDVPLEQLLRMREVIENYERLTGQAWDELQMSERACR